MLRSLTAILCLWSHTALATDAHVLVISGIGGEAEYSRLFNVWSLKLLDALEHELGVPKARLTYLAAGPQTDAARIDATSRKENILESINKIGSRANKGDVVALFLIGHGSMREATPLFNLPGPDISAAELAKALEPLGEQRVLVVNTSPSSGPFLPLLSGSDRIVITATQSGAENNHTVFASYLAAALASDAADNDKDKRISVLEAFEYARKEVERDYQSDRRLLTEHALLDDDGDGRGTLQPATEHTDGALARITYLQSPRARPGENESVRLELTRLRTRSDELAQQLEMLRHEKDRMEPEIYDHRLEELLVELTLNRRALQAAENGE